MSTCRHGGPVDASRRCRRCDDELTILTFLSDQFDTEPITDLEVLIVASALLTHPATIPGAVFDAARRIIRADQSDKEARG